MVEASNLKVAVVSLLQNLRPNSKLLNLKGDSNPNNRKHKVNNTLLLEERALPSRVVETNRKSAITSIRTVRNRDRKTRNHKMRVIRKKLRGAVMASIVLAVVASCQGYGGFPTPSTDGRAYIPFCGRCPPYRGIYVS